MAQSPNEELIPFSIRISQEDKLHAEKIRAATGARSIGAVLRSLLREEAKRLDART